jgi:hypothetical protein
LAIFFDLLSGLFAFQMALALFLMFGAPGVPWYKRAVAAFGSVGLAICVLALVVSPKTTDPFEQKEYGSVIVGVALLINIGLALRLFAYFRGGGGNFSCLGTIGRLIGCVAVAWGVFALVTIGIALSIGLVASIPSISIY